MVVAVGGGCQGPDSALPIKIASPRVIKDIPYTSFFTELSPS